MGKTTFEFSNGSLVVIHQTNTRIYYEVKIGSYIHGTCETDRRGNWIPVVVTTYESG